MASMQLIATNHDIEKPITAALRAYFNLPKLAFILAKLAPLCVSSEILHVREDGKHRRAIMNTQTLKKGLLMIMAHGTVP